MEHKALWRERKRSPILVALMVMSSFFAASCGGSSKEKETTLQETPAAKEEAVQGESAGEAESEEGLSITDIRKEDGGTYSATLNRAIVFKELTLKEDDSGKELLYFPTTPGRDGDRAFPIVWLDDRSIAVEIKKAIKDGKASGTGGPGALKVTGVKWKEFTGQSKLKGFADVTFNNAITVKGCKLIDGKDGLWMSWPSVKKGQDKYEDLIFAIDKGVREMVEAAVKKEAGM